MTVQILQGDALERLRELPSDHFHCVVTSPPYFSLRDYGTGAWEGGDQECDHVARQTRGDAGRPATMVARGVGGVLVPSGTSKPTDAAMQFRDVCGKCGARRIDQQIGLESSPDEWCARLVEVFREVRRVLRSDGVCFINVGDSYATSPAGNKTPSGLSQNRPAAENGALAQYGRAHSAFNHGCKPKDLIGAPWLLAFALRADGWWLRSEIIWAKPNPMPESVTDRPTKAHEQVFLLTKSSRYFYDAEAVRESSEGASGWAKQRSMGVNTWAYNNTQERIAATGQRIEASTFGNPGSRNMRSVWTIATDPLPSIDVDGEKLDHFASYPTELARRCIMAGTSAKGCCPACGAPWARVVERIDQGWDGSKYGQRGHDHGPRDRRAEDWNTSTLGSLHGTLTGKTKTTGWRSTCSCVEMPTMPCRVLDPFFGSGRTGLACEELDRDCTGIELNRKSVVMAKAQIERAKARRMIGGSERFVADPGQLNLFD